MNTKIIFLDDVRDPKNFGVKESNVIWLKNYKQFVSWIKKNGLPLKIYFDHDLGETSKSGHDAAKWLVNYCLNNNKDIPDWEVISANPVGRDNINGLLNFYKRKYRKGDL